MELRENQNLNPIYHAIDPGEGFRILALHPAKDLTNELVCSLIHTQLSNRPQYEALSYVWNQQPDPKPDSRESHGTSSVDQELNHLRHHHKNPANSPTVTLSNQKIPISHNLDRALRFLRKEDYVRHLWVDALCIHQQDLEERSKHVQYMSEIYRHCTSDLLRLGSDRSIIDDAFAAMASLGDLKAINERIADRD